MSVQANLWSAKLPTGEVRAGTIEQLGEAFRAGHVSEATLVCAAGSTQWSRLVDVLGAMASGAPPQAVSAPPPPVAQSVRPVAPSAAPAAVPAAAHPMSAAPAAPAPASMRPDAGETWQVKMADGQMRSGTRAQLEEAFRAGHLDSGVLVLASGATSWVPLAAILAPPKPLPAAFGSVAPGRSATPAPVAQVAPVAPVAPAPPVAASVAPAPAASQTPANGASWQVRMPDGQVRAGSPEQLEEAVRAGHLDARTMVLPPGAPQWVPLPAAIEGIANARSRSPAAPAQPVAPTQPVVPAQQVAPAPPAAAAPEEAPPAVVPSAPEPPPTVPGDTLAAAANAGDEPSAPESEDTKTDSGTTANGEATWHVKLTAAQLAAAFEAGIVHAETQVMEAGTDQWVSLSSVANAS